MNQTNLHREYRQAADRYRADNQMPGGLVLIYPVESDHLCGVCGWINELRDPNHWEPGVIAIDEHGNFYKAVGGDKHNGAKHWQEIGGGPAA